MATFSISGRGYATGLGVVEFNAGVVPDRLRGFMPQAGSFYERFYASSGDCLLRLRRHQMGIMTDALHLEDARGAVFLDVGAGSGAAVAYLNERFGSETIRAYGIEPALVKATSGLFKGGLEVVGSAPGLPSAFDVVAFLDVLEHFEDPAGVLARTREILKSGGKLLVKVPNREAALYQFAKCSRALLPGVSRQLFRRLYQAGYPPPHYFYFDRASLTALLTAAGFRVETVGFISETPLPHLWTRLWGMLFPVRVAAFIALSLFKLVAFGRRQECIYVVARVVP